MQTLSFPAVTDSPAFSLRELADRLLKSCKRNPVDVNRWPEWKRGRRDLSFEMIDNCLAAGGKREYARAIYLQKAAELVDPIDVDIPPLPEGMCMATEADLASDRALRMAALDGEITPAEARAIEETHTKEVKVIDLFLERLRRSSKYLTTRIG
jgi:hypothetical protein